MSPGRFRLALAGAAALVLLVAAATVVVLGPEGEGDPTGPSEAPGATGAPATPAPTPVPDGVLVAGPAVPGDLDEVIGAGAGGVAGSLLRTAAEQP